MDDISVTGGLHAAFFAEMDQTAGTAGIKNKDGETVSRLEQLQVLQALRASEGAELVDAKAVLEKIQSSTGDELKTLINANVCVLSFAAMIMSLISESNHELAQDNAIAAHAQNITTVQTMESNAKDMFTKALTQVFVAFATNAISLGISIASLTQATKEFKLAEDTHNLGQLSDATKALDDFNAKDITDEMFTPPAGSNKTREQIQTEMREQLQTSLKDAKLKTEGLSPERISEIQNKVASTGVDKSKAYIAVAQAVNSALQAINGLYDAFAQSDTKQMEAQEKLSETEAQQLKEFAEAMQKSAADCLELMRQMLQSANETQRQTLMC